MICVFDIGPVPSEISQNEQSNFFGIFCVKNMNLTSFKHYPHILGDFLGLETIILDLFLSETFLKYAMFRNSLRFCLTSKHLETKLYHQKHIKKKIEEKKSKSLNFLNGF